MLSLDNTLVYPNHKKLWMTLREKEKIVQLPSDLTTSEIVACKFFQYRTAQTLSPDSGYVSV